MTERRADTPRRRLLFVAANPSIDRLYELERLAVGAIHRPAVVVAVPGGKGLNAARAAATLGGSVTAAGILGGRAGDWIVEQLGALGIEMRVSPSSSETRTCVSVLDASTGSLTEIYERGAEIEPAAWDALEAIVQAELDRGDVAALALSGSLPPGAPVDAYGRIARLAGARALPVPVLVDAYGPALDAVLVERPAIVKVNAAEAGGAAGIDVVDPASAVEATRIVREAGATCVIVTLGGDGAVIATAEQHVHLVPPAIRGSYPVGSGDAVLAGLAVAFARGESITEAARFGLAAGIANAQVPGAGRLDRAFAEQILERIGVAPIR
jgi:1-phosphofructokinase family hexose kinase